jgi:hypothetical protein
VSGHSAPPGYDTLELRGTHVVVRADAAGAVRSAMASGTLYEWAARQPGAQPLEGRGTAWAATLDGGGEIVVRHSRHGGAFAALTGDLFLMPTRAPRELDAAIRLAALQVPTTEVIASAVYPVFGLLARADVATRRLEGADLPGAWRAAHTDARRGELMDAVTTLLDRMSAAGVVHPDLNLKNIFITAEAGRIAAFVLDVDRVEFLPGASAEVGRRNLARLVQSAGKWNREHALGMDCENWFGLMAESVGLRIDR